GPARSRGGSSPRLRRVEGCASVLQELLRRRIPLHTVIEARNPAALPIAEKSGRLVPGLVIHHFSPRERRYPPRAAGAIPRPRPSRAGVSIAFQRESSGATRRRRISGALKTEDRRRRQPVEDAL